MTNALIRSREWREPTGREVSEAALDAVDDDKLLAQILAGRGMTDPEKIRAFIDPNAYNPASPEALPDLARASEILEAAIKAGRRILIWGDFDVDGQTATALLLDGLRRLGADVVHYLPDRATESHGIRVDSLRQRIDEYAPGLLLTCDTGVSEFHAIEYAKSAGLPVVVTDHHDLGAELPPADAVVNPKRLGVDHPLRTLPGVGVAYKLMQHLFTSFGQARELNRLLDLVALGIVSDVAEQVHDTRYLLQLGMERLRRAERVGIEALLDTARITRELLTVGQVSYQIGPRLNAAGRIGDPMLAVELLTTRDRQRAYQIAGQLDALNNERKVLSAQIEAAAEELIAQNRALLDHEALVLYNPGWNASLLGGIANRLAERYFRPTVLLTSRSDDDTIATGSARAIQGYDVHAALAANADILRTFGGHSGAAGLSLDAAKVDLLRRRLSRTLAEMGVTAAPLPIVIDAVLTLDQLEATLVQRLERLAPFGEGNPPPVLMTRDLHLSHLGYFGTDSRHVTLAVEDDSGHLGHLLWWNGATHNPPEGRFDVAYTVGSSEYRDFEATLVDFRVTGELVVEIPEETALHIQDWRRNPDPAARLAEILEADPAAQIWAEAYSRRDHPHWKRRAELTPGATLVIYTAPSDPETLDRVLEAVRPGTVHLFAIEPPLDSVEAFLRQLVLAARNAIDHLNGEVRLDVLCGATAQSPRVIRAGLEFLAAEGQIAVAGADGETVRLAPGAGRAQDKAALRAALDRLKHAYDEVEAYRRFFRIQTVRRLFPK